MVSISTILHLLGGITALTLSYKLATFVRLYIQPSKLPRYLHGTSGSTWALVTGATDGIGYGFAVALLGAGFNVVLHGRSSEKLNKIKDNLGKQFPKLQVQIVIADAFSYDNGKDIENIVRGAESLPGKLTVLVNNVGGVPIEPNFASVRDTPSSNMDKIINLNARFPAQLTRALLPLLQTNSPALILNITSAVALNGLPYLGTYSPSKAYNYNFSQSLRAEQIADGHDVEVLGILVGNVTSGRNKVHIPIITCDSAQMARESLARVGCGKANVWGWWVQAVQYGIMDLIPESITGPVMASEMKGRMKDQDKKS